MTAFQPFAQTAQETNLTGSAGELVVASDDEKISFSGDIELRRDQSSLDAATKLRDILDTIIKEIAESSSSALPTDNINPIVSKKNPFG